MDHFDIVQHFAPERVPVRARRYLAGSDHDDVPLSIPMANDMVLELRPRGGAGDAAGAAAICRPVLDAELERRGAILFRGLPLADRTAFGEFIRLLGYPPLSYSGGIAVRNHEPGHALVASNEPGAITMAPHNEMAYLPDFPRKAFFYCARAADVGGEVPISDIRDSVKLIDPAILAKFRALGIRYHRYLPRDNRKAEIGWVETFGTADRAAIDRIMADKGYDHQWLDDDGLAYSYVNPAFVTHPATGEELWFNQVTELHCSYWRDHPDFPADLPDDRYPATTRWGDGGDIDPELISQLRAAIWRPARAVKLNPGDVLALDNLVIQHGRFAFAGPRLHMVAITR